MKIIKFSIYFHLIFLNVFHKISMEMLCGGDYCDAAEDEAIIQWYTQVYNFTQNNKNIGQHLQQIDEKLKNIEFKLASCQKELVQLHTQTSCNPKEEIVIQRRQDGSEDFFRTWNEYKQGFGNATSEFFIGLEKLHKLTNSRPYQLLIVMEDWENQRRYAKYDLFVIGSELEQYKLSSLGAYSGTAGDSLSYHLGFKFTTKDQDNDGNGDGNCAVMYKGGWWHNKCHLSNLNGLYLNGPIGGEQWAQGVVWKAFRDYTYSLKFVEMIIIRS